MKKVLLTILFSGIYLFANSQNASVETSVFGVQVGYLGIYGNYEAKLTNSIALRSELGIGIGSSFNQTINFATPELAIEPRWYYSLKRRTEKGKSIINNSSNFISLRTKYSPNLIIIGNDRDSTINDLSIAVNWGIRRHIGEHFNYEAGIGPYLYYSNDFIIVDHNLSIDLHVRIGYSF